MCGIAGIYDLRRTTGAESIKAMTDALRHRGPDDEGFLAVDTKSSSAWNLIGKDSKVHGDRIESFKNRADLFLGHRRLSIIDTSPLGHQPFKSNDGNVHVVFNGEIYNYVELRDELNALGYSFKTGSDTEVLVASYEAWGEKCLDRFNGMWAFVIYDKRRNLLFGSRDRFGVKPFYYYLSDGRFAFASEIKALLKVPFIPKEMNHTAAFDYLALGFLEHEEEGFFKGILELPPAFSFTLDLKNGEFDKKRYYTLGYEKEWLPFEAHRLDGYVSDVRQSIINAVSLRLRSDVPVGSCLSGGLDSSTIVCIVNNLLAQGSMNQVGERQAVFTACYDHPDIDESRWAGIVAGRTKTAWHKTFPKAPEMMADLEELVYHQDIPFGSTSIYAQYRVMKIAHENGIKVLLDGQGGDELFTGYQAYYGTFFVDILRNLDIGALSTELRGFGNSPAGAKYILKSIARVIANKTLPHSLKRLITGMLVKEQGYLNAGFMREFKGRYAITKSSVQTSLNEMLYEYITGLSLKSLLKYEDRNSMRFSIEARTPFADDINLIESVFKIPSSYKMHSGWSKFLMREATRGILPEEIRTRKDKVGFATPEYYWLKESKEQLKEYITDDLNDFMDAGRLRADWDMLIDGQTKQGITKLWRYINFAVWKKVYAL